MKLAYTQAQKRSWGNSIHFTLQIAFSPPPPPSSYLPIYHQYHRLLPPVFSCGSISICQSYKKYVPKSLIPLIRLEFVPLCHPFILSLFLASQIRKAHTLLLFFCTSFYTRMESKAALVLYVAFCYFIQESFLLNSISSSESKSGESWVLCKI